MTKISHLEPYLRPREKAIKEGINNLSNRELLALVIRCGVKGNSALEIADSILIEYGGLSEIIKADIYNLMKIKGIKQAKALELSAIIELVKRIGKEKSRNIKYINDANDVYKILKEQLENEIQECFIVLFLNIKLAIIKQETLFIGGETSSMIDVNLIFKKAMAIGAKRIICIHNHPSGDPTPSCDDILLTEKIRKIGKITNVELLDHIIIGKEGYLSFKNLKI